MRLTMVNSNEAAPSSSIFPPAYVDPKTGARQRPDSPTIGDSPIRVELALDRLVPPGFDLAMDLLVEVGHRAGADPGGAPRRVGDVLHPPYRHAGRCR